MNRLQWLLLVIFGLSCAAVGIFTHGFFLTRVELPNKSTCDAVPSNHANSKSRSNTACWMKPRFKRAILVVIDALRFDFADYQEKSDDGAPLHPFENKLLVIRDLVRDKPDNAMLLPFVADPPTTTMQRLKGVTTGGLPTFIEFKDDLAGEAITEDNLLDQLTTHMRNVTFMGDDTWMSLFPTSFTRSFPYPSFNVKDLHTVDNGVLEHLLPELQRDDWQVMVAHFLGVDHVGHRYGPDHPEMAAKLTQMNVAIEELVKKMDEDDMQDTVLFVFGDHGMTQDGNHGGATPEEVTAALFVYSPQAGFLGHKRKVLTQSSRNTASIDSEKLAHAALEDLISLHPQVSDTVDLSHSKGMTREAIHRYLLRARPSINQVDLAPTLSLLLGTPVPFGNLGSIIPEMFWFETDAAGDSLKETELERFISLNSALDINVAQVVRYLSTYAEHVNDNAADIQADDTLKVKLEDVRTTFAALWNAQAEWNSSIDKKDSQLDELIVLHRRAYLLGTEMLRVAGDHGRAMWTQFDLPIMGLGTAVLSVAMLIALVAVTKHVLRFGTPMSVLVPVAVGISIQVLSLFSNSYIVAEANVQQFVLATVSLFTLPFVRSCEPQSKGRLNRFVVLLLVIFVSASRFAVFRGEVQWVQGQEATEGSPSSTDGADANNDYSTIPMAFALSVALPMLLIPLCSLVLLWRFRVSCKLSVRTWVITCVALLQACTVVYYWHLQSQVTNSEMLGSIRHILPRLTYGGTALCLFWTLFGNLVESKHDQQTPTSITFELLLPWFPSYSLVIGPASPLVCLSAFSLLVVLFKMVKVYGKRGLLAIAYLWSCAPGIYFFATGHDNVFNKLHYASPFVGFDHYEWYRCGFMLALNTFGPHWLFTFALPFAVDTIPISKDDKTTQKELVSLAMLSYQFTYLARALATTIFVALQRRHLMVWAIFAPKYVFDCAILLNIGVMSMLSMSFHGWSTKPVEK